MGRGCVSGYLPEKGNVLEGVDLVASVVRRKEAFEGFFASQRKDVEYQEELYRKITDDGMDIYGIAWHVDSTGRQKNPDEFKSKHLILLRNDLDRSELEGGWILPVKEDGKTISDYPRKRAALHIGTVLSDDSADLRFYRYVPKRIGELTSENLRELLEFGDVIIGEGS